MISPLFLEGKRSGEGILNLKAWTQKPFQDNKFSSKTQKTHFRQRAQHFNKFLKIKILFRVKKKSVPNTWNRIWKYSWRFLVKFFCTFWLTHFLLLSGWPFLLLYGCHFLALFVCPFSVLSVWYFFGAFKFALFWTRKYQKVPKSIKKLWKYQKYFG